MKVVEHQLVLLKKKVSNLRLLAMVLVLAIATQCLIIYDMHNESIAVNAIVAKQFKTISDMNTSLHEYHVTEDYLMSIGATRSQAREIVKATEVYDLDPK